VRSFFVVVDASAGRISRAGRRRLGITTGQRVARVTGWTGARGHAVAGVALGVHAALAGAHVFALVVDARLVVTALHVGGALAAPASGERVAGVTGQARAHRSLLAGVIVAGLAPGVLATRVRFAKVSRLERAAPDERVAGHGPRAAAYGRRAPSFTVGVHSAHAATAARVHAPVAQARRSVRRAVGVRQTLGPTRSVRVAEVALRQDTHTHGINVNSDDNNIKIITVLIRNINSILFSIGREYCFLRILKYRKPYIN